jgi:hypothetical protein
MMSCIAVDPYKNQRKEFSAEKKNTDYLTLSCLSAYA